VAPGAEELSWAQGIVGVAEGAVQIDGRRVDKPVIERDRRVAARAAR
jgi:citrate lyase beta subunit